MYFKDTRKTNIINLLIGSKFSNVDVIDEVTEVADMLLVPWITSDIDMVKIKNSKCKKLIGHLEVNGFSFNLKGKACDNGLKQNVLKKFDLVLSGHFHSKQTQKNITYLGTLLALDFGEYGSPHGIHVLNNDKLEFIEYEDQMLDIIEYENKEYTDEELEKYDNKVVKIVVDFYDPTDFDNFLLKLSNHVFSYDVMKKEFILPTQEDDIDISNNDDKENMNLFLDDFLPKNQEKDKFIKIHDIFKDKLDVLNGVSK